MQRRQGMTWLVGMGLFIVIAALVVVTVLPALFVPAFRPEASQTGSETASIVFDQTPGPIDSLEEAWRAALASDSKLAVRASDDIRQGNLDQLIQDGRVTIQRFYSLKAESEDAVGESQFVPGTDDYTGPVWRVVIRGEARVHMLGIGADPDAVFSEVSYVFSSQSGDLLQVGAKP